MPPVPATAATLCSDLGAQGRRSSLAVLRRCLVVVPWLLRSRRNRVAAELGRHPLTPTDRRLLVAAVTWSVACSATCGAIVVALGDGTRAAAALVGVAVLVVAPLAAAASPRTRTVGLVRSAYHREGPWSGPSAVSLAVADGLARLASLLGVLLVSLGPALVVVLAAQWGPVVAVLLAPAVLLLGAAVGVLACVGSLLRLGAGAHLAVSVGYHADLLVRAAGAAGVAGCGAYVVGRLARATEASGPPAALRDLHVTGLGVLLLVAGAVAAIGTSLVLLARVARSTGLERTLRRLARQSGDAGPAPGERLAPSAWEDDAVRTKERALVRRTRAGRRSGADGLVAVSSALVGGVVGLVSSGLVTSSTGRLVALMFGLLLVGELVGDGLRRVDSVDADGAATTWLLVSRRHVRHLVRLRAVRHARTLAVVVASVLVVATVATSLPGPQVVLVGAAGALVVVVSTIAIVGTTARHPRWDWTSVDEIGMHPAAQAQRFATTGVLWMVVFCLAAVGHRLAPTTAGPTGDGTVLPLAAGALLVLGGLAVAPSAAVALGRSTR